jgi:hypothetical protein
LAISSILQNAGLARCTAAAFSCFALSFACVKLRAFPLPFPSLLASLLLLLYTALLATSAKRALILLYDLFETYNNSALLL